MKFIYLLLFSLNAFGLNAQTDKLYGTKGYAVYKANSDSSILEEQLQKVKREKPEAYGYIAHDMRAARELLSTMSLELYFDQQRSLFRASPLSVEKKVDNPMVEQMAKSMGRISSPVYLDKKERLRKVETTIDQGVTYYHVEEEFNLVDWKLSNKTKKIGCYNCRFATGVFITITHCCGPEEIPVAAWFAPEIPLPFGPAELSGLPGLVIQGSVGDPQKRIPVVFSLESIVIGEDAYSTFPKLNKPKETLCREEFDNMLRSIVLPSGN